eukprot:TRINITY_DN28146_c0_g1_i1.p1 TRINITY_DN28146_c0_g1~~TRINITY_DN28146_c0_g1_i1.p1  ORF type:complete len:365 (-),score=47.32 TRINITY_DN28146_c0_g1_i1:53-1147(-)
MTESRTQPPPLLSEADLISLMDRNGIGTDATMHEHIQKIQTRTYAIKNADGRLEPSRLGLALVEGYQRFALEEGMDLSKPLMRSQMEQGMAAIARGEQDRENFLQGALAVAQRCYSALERNAPALDAALGQHFTGRAQVGRAAPIARPAFSNCRCGASLDLRCHTLGGGVPGGGGAGPPPARGRGRGRARSAAGRGRGRAAAGRGRAQAAQPGRGGRGRGAAAVRQERFLVCPNVACGIVLPLPSRQTQTITPFGHVCPICAFQVLNVRNEDTGREHRLCPYCFNYVPQDLHRGMSELRCFQCAHASCPLAGGRGNGGQAAGVAPARAAPAGAVGLAPGPPAPAGGAAGPSTVEVAKQGRRRQP